MRDEENTGPQFPLLVSRELRHARIAHPPISTRHEGIAVIEEEFLELRGLVYQKHPVAAEVVREAVQIAAMCQRFVEDLGLVARQNRSTPEAGQV